MGGGNDGTEKVNSERSRRSSTKSKATDALEDAKLREKAQEKELEALMMAVEAKRKEIEKTREVTAIHAERVKRLSGRSESTSKLIEPDEEEEATGKEKRNEKGGKGRKKGDKTDKGKE